MAANARKLYDTHFTSKQFERIDLFKLLANRFGIQRALYPGSFVHISPSFVIPSVVYVDSDRRCPAFFEDPSIRRLVRNRKSYEGKPEIVFLATDYSKPISEEDDSFDLLISQWAGPVSQACKRYLKVGGVLVANNSHGDASLASLDHDYELVAVLTLRDGKYRLNEKDLGSYFVLKSSRVVTAEDVKRTGRGIAYTKSPAAYVFRRAS